MKNIKSIHEEIRSIAKDSPKYRSTPITDFNKNVWKEDIYVFFIIRKMIRRFLTKGEVNEKLLLNNIIICLNIFGSDSVNRILRLMTNDEEFSIIKTILIFLNTYNLKDDHCPQNKIIKDILNNIIYRYTHYLDGKPPI